MIVTEMLESKFLSADDVKRANQDSLVILSSGEAITYGAQEKRLRVVVEFCQKQKYWTINTQTLKNLAEAWGDESDRYVGKVVKIELQKNHLKRDVIIGRPL